MTKFEPPSMLLLIMYAIAAVSGGLGGCAAASYYFTHNTKTQIAFILAYIILGIAMGVGVLAVILVYYGQIEDVSRIILYSGLSGAAGSIALASANFSAKAYFKRLGIEVQVTLREPEQERREEDGTS